MDVVFRDIELQINKKLILNKISGVARKGEMLAIMGPSGAGKSTLLSALAGRLPVCGGLITLNGQVLEKQLSRKMRLVLQEDMFFPTLTLKETLTFAALLTLPERMPHHLKLQRVDEIISLLELDKCKNTVMGNAFMPGLSGGERKRAAIACEIITDPSILLIDEPTSGLDYSIASNLVNTLQKYSNARLKTVIASIHQPSSRIFYMFTNILLIADGQVVYFGACAKVLDHFHRVGLLCKPLYNPADFIIEELRAGSENQEKLITESLNSRTKYWPNEIKNELSKAELEDIMKKHARRRRSSVANLVAGIFNDGFVVSSKPSTSDGVYSARTDCVEDQAENGVALNNGMTKQHEQNRTDLVDSDTIVRKYTDISLKWPTGYWTQYKVLTRRLFIYNRHVIFSRPNVLRYLFQAIISAIIWFQLARTEEVVNDRIGMIFFTTVSFGFDTLLGGLATFQEERPIIEGERTASLYRLSAYWMAKQTSELPLTFVMPIVYTLIVYFAVGLTNSAWVFFAFLAQLLNFILAMQGIGLLLSVWIVAFAARLCTGNVLMVSFLLLGGYFQQNLGKHVSWARYASPVTYLYYGLLTLEFRYGDNFECLPDNTTSYEVCLENDIDELTGEDVLDKLDISLPIWTCNVVMFATSVLFRYLSYLVLRFLRRPASHK